MFIIAVPIIKLFAWGEGDSGGHVLRETTSRGLCGLVCPSRTSGRGGEGYCVKEGGGGEGERERERELSGAATMTQPSTLRLILGTREEPGTLTQGGALFSWFLSFGKGVV